MRILYIGSYSEGGTSKMRALTIKELLSPEYFDVIDYDTTLLKYNRVIRSATWRYKIGPYITDLNKQIINKLNRYYDLIWVDKGIFIKESTITQMKKKTSKLVHYTPDCAFHTNKSRFFNNSIPYYDYSITTKSFEIDEYKKRGVKHLIFTTQGYNSNLHKPNYSFIDKEDAVCFIGLYEKSRGQMISQLISNGIKVNLGGVGWDMFVEKSKLNPNLNFIGDRIFGIDYAKALSKSKFGLGMLSKKFPELHTTRTFEIPACGSILLTEQNIEIESFFTDNDVVYYHNSNNLVEKIKHLINNPIEAQIISDNGKNVVQKRGFSYSNILMDILNQVL